MGLSTAPAAYPKDPDFVAVMILVVVAMSSIAALGPAGCTDYVSQHRCPMRIQFRKAIVGDGNVEYYYCIIWEAGQPFIRFSARFLLSFRSSLRYR